MEMNLLNLNALAYFLNAARAADDASARAGVEEAGRGARHF